MIEVENQNKTPEKDELKQTETALKPSLKATEIVAKSILLSAGTYFGHKTAVWNPKMKPYIHMARRGIHIIDIIKTQKTLEFAYQLIKKFAEKNASFIFVGTRKQAQNAIKNNALRTRSSYVSERWLGGTLTNNRTIFSRVKRLNELEKLADRNYEGFTKKEGVDFSKELAKLQKNLSGIRNMRQIPNVMIIADPSHDEIAVKEARRLGIKVIGIIDTNCDPSIVDVAIPANDDSLKSVTLIITILADAIAAAKNGKQEFAYQSAEKILLPEEPKKKRFIRRNNYVRRDYTNPRVEANLATGRIKTDSKPNNKLVTAKAESKTTTTK